MQSQQSIPKECPVCGSANVTENRLRVRFADQERIPPSLITYRCDKGHVFYIDGNSKAASSSQ